MLLRLRNVYVISFGKARQHLERTKISVTISVGLDSMPETTISDELELITNADEALYRSKNSGRDKVTIH